MPVIEWIADAIDRPADPTLCHAGLVHTYGYLFSPVDTDYGRKRHRWTTQEVAHTLGIPGDWPLNAQTGILSALTSTIEAVAPLDREPLLIGVEHALQTDVAIELRGSGRTDGGTPWSSRIRLIRRAGLEASVPPEGDELLPVYSLRVGEGPECYITDFHVKQSYAAALDDADHSRLRFLAVAD